MKIRFIAVELESSDQNELAAVLDQVRLLLQPSQAEPQQIALSPIATPAQLPPPEPEPAAEGPEPVVEDAPAAPERTPTPPAPKAPPYPPQRRPMPASHKWPFEQFDQLVRAEMQRLAVDGVMPSGARWNRERSPQLPTITGVVKRYGAKNHAALAAKLGFPAYDPPAPGRKPKQSGAKPAPKPHRVRPVQPSPLALQTRQRIDADKAALAATNGDRGHL